MADGEADTGGARAVRRAPPRNATGSAFFGGATSRLLSSPMPSLALANVVVVGAVWATSDFLTFETANEKNLFVFY